MFTIRKGIYKDICRIREIMEIAHNTLIDKSWYYIDGTTIDWLVHTIKNNGFMLVAEADNDIVGFLVVSYPGEKESNLGNYVHHESIDKKAVAHMEPVAVLPQYRGHHLQRTLIELAETMIPNNIKYLMCTVHPDNYPSYCNMSKSGYDVICEIENKYAGSPRCVFMKKK